MAQSKHGEMRNILKMLDAKRKGNTQVLRNISEKVTIYVPCNKELASTIVLLKTSFQKVLKWKFKVRLYQE
jgi:hypothetical protein